MIRILKFGEIPDSEIFARDEKSADVSGIVADIIGDVRSRGDEALFDYCGRFDKAELSCLAVTQQELEEALPPLSRSFWRFWKKRREIFVLSTKSSCERALKASPPTVSSPVRRSLPSKRWACMSPAARQAIRPRF